MKLCHLMRQFTVTYECSIILQENTAVKERWSTIIQNLDPTQICQPQQIAKWKKVNSSCTRYLACHYIFQLNLVPRYHAPTDTILSTNKMTKYKKRQACTCNYIIQVFQYSIPLQRLHTAIHIWEQTVQFWIVSNRNINSQPSDTTCYITNQ
jgi:hypothetical protein